MFVYLIATNRNQFSPSASSTIDTCIYSLVLVAIDGILMSLGPEVVGISIAQMGEWFAFYSDFFIRWQLSKIIKYNTVLVPQKQE